MAGFFIDNIRSKFKKNSSKWEDNIDLVATDFGVLRVLDSGGTKPIIISTPDGPNVIEHHAALNAQLSEDYRVICFELPGFGFSYPNSRYDYSISKGAELIIDLMDLLKIRKAALAFSCCNGLYAAKATELFPERVSHLFLIQTPSLEGMNAWANSTIPKLLKYPVLGQLVNAFSEKKLANVWYKQSLPRGTDLKEYQAVAVNTIKDGGCFCLSSLVQGLSKSLNSELNVNDVPSTLMWGKLDYTHRKTSSTSILEHIPNCEIEEFENCAHFPDLEDTSRFIKIVKDRY